MLKSVMQKHFIGIILFLLCLLVSSRSEARITIGVVTGPDAAAGEVTSTQAKALGSLLAVKLHEEVAVKELSDAATLIDWLDRFAMLDLALLPTKEVKANIGRFLQIGPFDKQNRFNLVASQSVDGDLLQRLSRLIREPDAASWRAPEVTAPLAKQRPGEVPPHAEPEPTSINEVIAPQVGLQHVPPLKPGRAWAPQEEGAFFKMAQTEKGQALMAALKISEIVAAEGVLIQPTVVDQEPEPAMVTEKLLHEQGKQAVEELLPPPVEYAAPVEPVAPIDVITVLPEFPQVTEPAITLPMPQMPDLVVLPAPVAMPTGPVSPAMVEIVKVPDLLAPQSAPLQRALPPATVEVPVTIPAYVAAVLPSPLAEAVVPDYVAPRESGQPEVAVIEQVLTSADAMPVHELAETAPVVINHATEAWSDEEFAAVLGEDMVAAVVAQPDLPQELRLSEAPIVRPGRLARPTPVAEDELLLASLPEPFKNIAPSRPPNLLPEQEPEPGVIYVVPFVAIMVPDQVYSRVFDQFVDTLNREGEALGLQFVILKEGLERVSPQWLSVRKYVTGEVYAYVEDSGCCSTDLRTKARLTYHRPNQESPVFRFEYPVKSFFDHDRSSLDVERIKLSDDIAVTLSTELLKTLQN